MLSIPSSKGNPHEALNVWRSETFAFCTTLSMYVACRTSEGSGVMPCGKGGLPSGSNAARITDTKDHLLDREHWLQSIHVQHVSIWM